MVNLDDIPPQKPEFGIILIKADKAALEENIYPQPKPYVPSEYTGSWIGLTQKTANKFQQNIENDLKAENHVGEKLTCNRAAAHHYANYWPSWDDESINDYDDDDAQDNFWQCKNYDYSQSNNWSQPVPVPTKDYAFDQSTQWEEPDGFNTDLQKQNNFQQQEYDKAGGGSLYTPPGTVEGEISKSRQSSATHLGERGSNEALQPSHGEKSQDHFSHKSQKSQKSENSIKEKRSQKSLEPHAMAAENRKSQDQLSYKSQGSGKPAICESVKEQVSKKSLSSQGRRELQEFEKVQDPPSHHSQKSCESKRESSVKLAQQPDGSIKEDQSRKSINISRSQVVSDTQKPQEHISVSSKKSLESFRPTEHFAEKDNSFESVAKQSPIDPEPGDRRKSTESAQRPSESMGTNQKSRDSLKRNEPLRSRESDHNLPYKPYEAPCENIDDSDYASLKSKESVQHDVHTKPAAVRSRDSIQEQKDVKSRESLLYEHKSVSEIEHPQKFDEPPCETIQDGSRHSQKSKEHMEPERHRELSRDSQRSQGSIKEHGNVKSRESFHYNQDEVSERRFSQKSQEAQCEYIQEEDHSRRKSLESVQPEDHKQSIQKSHGSQQSIQRNENIKHEDYFKESQKQISEYDNSLRSSEAPCETIQNEGSFEKKSRESIQAKGFKERSLESEKSTPAPCDEIQSQGHFGEKSRDSIQAEGSSVIQKSTSSSKNVDEKYSKKEDKDSRSTAQKTQASIKDQSRLSRDMSHDTIKSKKHDPVKSQQSLQSKRLEKSQELKNEPCEDYRDSVASSKKPWDKLAETITGRKSSDAFNSKEHSRELELKRRDDDPSYKSEKRSIDTPFEPLPGGCIDPNTLPSIHSLPETQNECETHEKSTSSYHERSHSLDSFPPVPESSDIIEPPPLSEDSFSTTEYESDCYEKKEDKNIKGENIVIKPSPGGCTGLDIFGSKDSLTETEYDCNDYEETKDYVARCPEGKEDQASVRSSRYSIEAPSPPTSPQLSLDHNDSGKKATCDTTSIGDQTRDKSREKASKDSVHTQLTMPDGCSKDPIICPSSHDSDKRCFPESPLIPVPYTSSSSESSIDPQAPEKPKAGSFAPFEGQCRHDNEERCWPEPPPPPSSSESSSDSEAPEKPKEDSFAPRPLPSCSDIEGVEQSSEDICQTDEDVCKDWYDSDRSCEPMLELPMKDESCDPSKTRDPKSNRDEIQSRTLKKETGIQEDPKSSEQASSFGMGKYELTVYIFKTIRDILWCILGP